VAVRRFASRLWLWLAVATTNGEERCAGVEKKKKQRRAQANAAEAQRKMTNEWAKRAPHLSLTLDYYFSSKIERDCTVEEIVKVLGTLNYICISL